MIAPKHDEFVWIPGQSAHRPHHSHDQQGHENVEHRLSRRSASIHVSAVISGQRPKFDPQHHYQMQDVSPAQSSGIWSRIRRSFNRQEFAVPTVAEPAG